MSFKFYLKKTFFFYREKKNLFNRKQAEKILRQEIQGRNVMIIGSGPSAQLTFFEKYENVLFMACNKSPLIAKHINIHVYASTSQAYFESEQEIQKIIESINPEITLFNKRGLIKSSNKLCLYDPKDLTNIKKLLKKKEFKNLLRIAFLNEMNFMPSTGVQLILHALLAGANSITLTGFDTAPDVTYFSKAGYQTDPLVKKNRHYTVDMAIIKSLSHKYQDIIYVENNRTPLSIFFETRS